MAEVYYFVPADWAEDAIECGISLSGYSDRELEIEGRLRKCLTALLNPKDDSEKYNNRAFKCLKIQVLSKYCYVADDTLYKIGKNIPEVMDKFLKSIIPVEEYCFGSYRHPVCLVTSSVIAGDISLLDSRLDSPVLFDNSEELYLNNLIENGKEDIDGFSDHLLYFYYDKLAELGAAAKYEDLSCGLAAFISLANGKTCTVKIPEIGVYSESGRTKEQSWYSGNERWNETGRGGLNGG